METGTGIWREREEIEEFVAFLKDRCLQAFRVEGIGGIVGISQGPRQVGCNGGHCSEGH